MSRLSVAPNLKARDIEIVQHEQRQSVSAADAIDEPPRRGDARAFRRDDHEVMALGELHGAEQRREAFLFAEQHAGEIAGMVR